MAGTVYKDLTVCGGDMGVVIVTIAGSPVDISPAAKSVTSCLVQCPSGTVYMNIDAAATNAKWLLSTVAIPVPIDDLSRLHFLGASGSEKVQILWRS